MEIHPLHLPQGDELKKLLELYRNPPNLMQELAKTQAFIKLIRPIYADYAEKNAQQAKKATTPLKNAQKISEKSDIKPKKMYEEIILESTKATLENNPNIGLETAVKAVIKEVLQRYRLKSDGVPSVRTCVNKLKKQGVTRERKSGYKTEKIEVILRK